MRLPRRRLIALAAAALPLGSARAAGALRVAVPDRPRVLDPHLALTPLDRAVAAETFLGLVGRDGTGAPSPALAESWAQSSDGTSYTFELRRDARWSDGSAITAQDVVFSVQRALNPDTGAPFAALLGRIAGGTKPNVQADGRHSVRIGLTQRSARFLGLLAHPVAAVVPRAIVSRASATWTSGARVVCSGPFTPVEAGARLERNLNSFLPPVADGVQFDAVESFEAAVDRIRAGDADVALGFAPEPVADRNLQRTLHFDRGQAVAVIAVNLTRLKLRTREIRHALGMLIDRERLLRSLRIPNATAAYAPVPPDVKTAPEPHPAPYQKIDADDRRVIAQVLLQEEDITPATPATFRLLHTPGRVNAAIAKAVAESWMKSGVQLDVQIRSAGDAATALMTGDYDLALVTSAEIGATAWPYIASFAKAAGPDNLPHYVDEDFETHLETASISLDPNGLSIAIGNAEGVLTEDQIVLPLFAFRPGQPVGNGVSGWEANTTGIHPLRTLAPRT